MLSELPIAAEWRKNFNMLDRLYTLVEIFVVTLCLSHLHGERYKPDYRTMMLFLLDTIILQGINDHYFPDGSSLLIYPMVVFYCVRKYKRGVKSALINTVLTFIILSLLQLVSVICVGMLVNLGVPERVILLIANLLMLILFILFAKCIPLQKVSFYFQKGDLILYIIMLCGVTIIVVSGYLIKMYEGIYLEVYLIVYTIIVFACIMAASWERYKVKALEKEMELQAYKVYEESFKNLITEVRVRQHDFKNHINAIYIQHMMCRTYDELVERQKKYCEDIVYENRFADLLRLGDTMIIGFLYGKLTEADGKGIDVQYRFACGELKTEIPMYKLITILGNLLNNAIEALENNERKLLFVGMDEDEKELHMEVRNTNEAIAWCDVTSLFKKGYSTKGDGRGLGLYSIKKMSREYGFDILFANKEIDGENWVSFEIRIQKE